MIGATFCLLGSLGATFDYSPPRISWQGWTVGYSYMPTNVMGALRSYPIINLIDDDPKTAWMVGGALKLDPDRGEFRDPAHTEPPHLFVVFPKVTAIDGIRMMPGYNKSENVFRENNRITKISLLSTRERDHYAYVESPFHSAKFTDSMGWHETRFKSREVGTLLLRIDDWVKGADNDICISELQILSGGKAIPWNLGPAVLKTSGSECGCGTQWHVVNRVGKIIRSVGPLSEFEPYSYDPTSRYVLSHTLTQYQVQFYVLDTVTGKFVAHGDVPKVDNRYIETVTVVWSPGRAVADVQWSSRGSLVDKTRLVLNW